MDYKMVCIDMDGTLLNREHKVSEASKAALKKAHDKGVHIVISTGRIYTDAKEYSNLIGTESAVIASNGAYIREKDNIIYKSVFPKETCMKLVDVFETYKVRPLFYTPEKIYYGNILFRFFSDYLKLRGYINKTVKYKWIKSRRAWENIFELEKDNIVKCEIINVDLYKIRMVREALEKLEGVQITSSSKTNIEINCTDICKGTAVEYLTSYYNLDRSQVIVIGDSENDISMIEYAGLGIAMENATDQVKEKADYITDANSMEGVAKAINKFINEE